MAEVAVIIPAYNRSSSIMRSIDSALAQTFTDIEIIVVDDASTDDTVAVVSAVPDQRVLLVLREENGGASAARNTGIAAATADYVAFLDSDDEWTSDKLAIQLPALKASEPRCLVSCTGVMLHLLDRGIDMEFRLDDSTDWIARMASGCDQRPGSTLLARRDVFTTVGDLDTSLARFEDWDWLLRYVRKGHDVHTLPQPLAHIHNVRGRVGPQTEKSADAFLQKHAGFYASLPSKQRRKALCDLWLQIAATFALEGRPRDAARMAARAILQRPAHAVVRLASYAREYASLKLKRS
ncbi:MAG: glycosyltransferase family A protein [Pseudomonadota bacterium]